MVTVDEFKDKINRKFVVKCDSISERNLTLELLIALGYEINEPSMKYLEPGNQDFDYPHPVMDSHGGQICCMEYVARVVQRGMEESDIVPMITASVTKVDDEEQVGNTRANLRKRGRLLVSSYDAVRAQKLDLFSVTLRQIGSYIAHTRLEDAVDVLVNGDCNSKAAEVASLNGRIFGYNTLLDFWAQFDPYEMNIALASNDVALDLLKMPEFQNPSAGFSFQQPHCVTMPFGPMLIRSNAVPQNTVIGIDKRFALEMGQVGDVTTEYDKLIDRQFERTAITIISGFSKIYDEASRVLSTSLQKKR